MSDNRVHVAAAAFSGASDVYEASRPSYPVESVDFILETSGLKQERAEKPVVVDLAAGTGKFTRLLPAHLKIIAVEPAEGMRNKLIEVLPNITAIDGTAEKIPLESSSADLVTVAQAFHWFSHIEAVKEMHRVLKPGGYLCLIWNIEDSEANPWFLPLEAIFESIRNDDVPQYLQMKWRKVWEEQSKLPIGHPDKLFHDEQVGKSHHTVPFSYDKLWDRALSKSFVALLDDDKKAALKARIDAEIKPLVATDKDGNFSLKFSTTAYMFKKI